MFLILFFIPVLTVMGGFNPAWANDPVKVGVFQNRPIVYHEKGPKGLFVDVLDYVAVQEKWDVQYESCKLEECLERLKANQLDLMLSLGESPERSEHFSFSREPIWTFWGVVYTKDNRINGILDLRYKRIGVRRGNRITAGLKHLLSSFTIPVDYIEFDNYEAAFEALEQGSLEAVAVNNTYAVSRMKKVSGIHKTGIVFNPFSVYFAVSKSGSKPALLNKIDGHVRQLKSDPNSILQTFHKAWSGPSEASVDARRMGILSAAILLISILAMAAWRYRSMVRINADLKDSMAERNRVEIALRRSKERFKLAMDASRDGLWDWDLHTDVVYYSPGYLTMLGYAEGDVPPHVDFWKQHLHPNDLPHTLQVCNTCVENRCADFQVEFRMRAKDGQWRWILGRGMAVSRDADGRALRLVGTHTDITRQKRIEDALRESESKMRSIFRAAPTGIGVVSQRVFQEVNQRFCDLVGYTQAELLGESSRMLYASDAEYERVGRAKYNEIDSCGTGTVETRMQRKDGKIIDVLLSSSPLNPDDLLEGVSFTALDISAAKQVEADLRESESKYRSMMESMEDPVYICSPEYRVEYMNPAMIRRTGRDAFGERCHKALHGLDERCSWCQFSRSQAGQNWEYDIVSPRDNRSYHISCSPIVHADGSVSKMTVYRDTTDIKKMEHQFRQAQRMESIGTLAGGIAHDFNNILFPMSGYTEMLMEEIPPDNPAQNKLEGIFTGIKRATELVKQILAFSRQSDHEMKPLQAQLVVKEVLKLIRATLPATVRIRQNIDRDCRLVMADYTQIHQVTMNLVTNAYHAIEDTGGTLAVTLKEVELTADGIGGTAMVPGPHLCLTVADSGPGIEQHILDRIFDPYFTTKKEGKGTGLGLSVAHGIVKNHGGLIRVTSTCGKGSEFMVYLPVIQSDAEVETLQEKVSVPQGSGRVLLVDDEEIIAKMFAQMVERLGYQVVTRTSSIGALEVFKHNPHSFDLVITDMTMPNMTGAQLIQKLAEVRPDMPAILCTGFSEKMSPEKAAALGIKSFLMKPIVRNELAVAIREALAA